VAARAHLSVGDVYEADDALILVFLLFVESTLDRNGSRHFLLGSDAEFLVLLSVGCLMLLGSVLGVETTAALEGGWLGAARKGAVRSGLRRGRGHER